MLQKWDKVAELLGVKMGVDFRVLGINKSREEDVYRVTKSGVKVASKVMSGVWLDDPYFPILEILRQGLKCVEVPWKPKLYDSYWVLCGGVNDEPEVLSTTWYGGVHDLTYYKNGWAYRKKEECERNKKSDYEKMTGEKWKW